MAKYDVAITRSASITLTYSIESDSADNAESIVQKAIDKNNISTLGTPIDEVYHDDDESVWEVIDVELR